MFQGLVYCIATPQAVLILKVCAALATVPRLKHNTFFCMIKNQCIWICMLHYLTRSKLGTQICAQIKVM